MTAQTFIDWVLPAIGALIITSYIFWLGHKKDGNERTIWVDDDEDDYDHDDWEDDEDDDPYGEDEHHSHQLAAREWAAAEYASWSTK